MKPSFRKSYLRLLVIMILVTLITTGLCIVIIYKVVYNEKKVYLKELCINQQIIIQSIYKETRDEKRILNILRDQMKNRPILGKTGEYIVATLKDDSVNFLLDLRRSGYSNLHPMHWGSFAGLPIKTALSKKSGFVTGPDYSDTESLAYCTYIPELNWGLVAKLDKSEVNYPFYHAGMYAILASLVLVLIGTQIFQKTFDPIIARIINSENRYRSLFDYSAIPLWEVDFSRLKIHFDKLKNEGIKDFRSYFENHGNEIKYLTSLAEIKEVSQKAVNFFDVNNKDEIIKNLLFYFNEDSLSVFKDELIGFAEGSTHFETELPIRTYTGEIRTLLFNMSVMPGHENDLKEVLISFVDITKRKQAENSLLENEASLKRSQEIAHLGSWEYNPVNDILKWSDEVYRILGFEPGELKPQYETFMDMIHPDDRKAVAEVYFPVGYASDGIEIEHRIIRKMTGEIRYVYEKCSYMWDKAGNLIRSEGMIHDITDRKYLENTQSFLVKAGWVDSEEEFFSSLVRYLSETLRMDYVRIDRLTEGDTNAESAAIYFDGHFENNIKYSFKQFQGMELSSGEVFCYPENVRDLFPDDRLLERVGAESLTGITLWSSSNKPIGFIILISRRPVRDKNMVESVLRLVAVRTSGEMERKTTEEALKESEQKLKYHFENSPLAVVEWDTDFFIINWSKEAERMFGWKAEEVLGKRIDKLNIIFEEDIPIVENTMKRLSCGKEHTVVSSNRNFTKSGSVIECIWYNSVLFDSRGRLASTMSLVENITERRKAEEELIRSKENIKIILDATQESLYMFDRDGTIVATNITAADRLKCAPEEIIGHHFSDFIPEDVALTRQGYLNEVYNTGKPVQFEDIRADFSFEHNFFPVLQNDKVTAVVSFSRDITERKRAEEAIRKSEAQLRELNATKDKFFNIVAHDLKNPFTSLLGSTELLYSNIGNMDSVSIVKLAQILNESAKSGYAILLNLLDWSRSQTGILKVKPEKINLKEVIELNISELNLLARHKKITIKSGLTEDYYLITDKNMMNTLLRNLLSNGAKFTGKGGTVTVNLSVTANDAILSVKDTGVGISEENINKLFRIDTRFQLPGTDNEQGTGLGLKLCSEFVTKLGGEIWVESKPGVGSEFKFSIPLLKNSSLC